MSKEHSSLLRRFDRETKANKRLSMDKEELEWRLSQDMSGIGDFLNRSISHSPTSSAASTPEPTRRRKSPLPPQQSPRSPRSADAFDPRSPVILRTHQNGSARLKTTSSDFERPMFSPRHSSADLFVTTRYEDISEASDEPSCSGMLTSPRSITASTRHTLASSPKSRHSAPQRHDDALMTSSTHSEPAVTSSCTSDGQPRPTLRRSGTYELLEMEMTDETTLLASPKVTSSSPCSDLKQSDV